MIGFELDLQLDREGDVSLVEQIREAVRLAIASGTLVEGRRLPSTRQLASKLRVNRQTAVDAYRRLEIEGLIEQRRGAGAFVRHPTGANRQRLQRAPGEHASQALLSYEQRQRSAQREAPQGALDLAGLAPHERGYPSEAVAESLNRALTRRGSKALGYGPPAGDPELREILAQRLRARGLDVDAAGLLIVGVAQQGLDLLFRALLDPGDAVLTEAPTYHLCLDLLAFHQARVASVPLVPRQEPGMSTMDFEALGRLLDREKPRVAYAMPTFQNPTGLSLDLASRRTLARMLRERNVLLIEDDYEADMRFSGEPLPAVASLPESGDVVYLGTLSKSLFPGLRVGWLAGNPDVLARVAQVKRISDLSGPLLLQAVAADLLGSGAYDAHVAVVAKEARQRMDALVQALSSKLPEGARVTRPHGGHVAWLEAPAPSGRAIADAAAERGVLVTPGEAFVSGPPASAAVRLSIARIEDGDVARAAEALASAVSVAMTEGRRSGRDVESPVSV